MTSSISLLNQVGYQVQAGESVDSMIDNAGLNWEVETSPYTYGAFNQFTSEGRQMAYRSDNGHPFGEYIQRVPMQNHQMITMFQRFLDVADLKISTIGALNNGNQIFAVADLGKDHSVVINPRQHERADDIISAHLGIVESHLCGTGTEVFLYLDRLVCRNGLSQKVKSKVATLHHKGAINTQTVQKVLASAISELRWKKDVYNKLADTSMNKDQAVQQLISAFGHKDKEWDDQPDIVKNVYHLFCGEAIGSDLPHCFDTAYQLLQSLTDYQTNRTRTESQENRFASILSGDYAKQAAKLEKQLCAVYVH